MTYMLTIAAGSIVLSLAMLWAFSQIAARKKGKISGGPQDVASSLRELLLAKAEGKIGDDEFERRQAGLYAAVLETPAAPSRRLDVVRYWKPALAALFVTLAAWGLSVLFGSDKTTVPAEAFTARGTDTQGTKANSGGDLNTAVKRLADKLAADPNNGEGWQLLAKTYNELHKYAEADAAYAKAAALLPPDAAMLADWADTHVMANNRKWDDESRKIVKRALAADPKHVKSLALAGSEAFDRGDYKGAIELWKRMKAAAPADSMDGKLADANIAEANAMLSGKKPAESAPAATNAVVGGVVTLSPKLRAQVSANDTIFVIARATDGTPAPLAVFRYQGNDFPIEFRLDDNLAILPGRKLSDHAEVVVSAKLSKNGNAESAPGDILSRPVKTKLGNTTLALELNAVR